ncbi:unnamed protein product, partial [Porites evermanni]
EENAQWHLLEDIKEQSQLWAGGSEILNLSNKESAIGALSVLHEIVQPDGIGKLDAMFLVEVFASVCDSVRGKWKLCDSRDSESVHAELMTPNLFSWKDFMFPSALKTLRANVVYYGEFENSRLEIRNVSF